jgi:NAD(P)-dependent dehydrogenase (short-subunit alcohol dehydrogenase family)
MLADKIFAILIVNILSASIALARGEETCAEGRVAIVTGAGGGLGRAHALYLAGQGAKVVVNDLSQEAAERVAAEIVARAARRSASPPRSPTRRPWRDGRQVAGALGPVDILINNAGILRDKSFAKMSRSTISGWWSTST